MFFSSAPSWLKSKLFWGVFTALSLTGYIVTAKYFTKVIPCVALDVSLTRTDALHAAQELTNEYNWDITNHQSAIAFDTDSNVQIFAELDCGGIDSFTSMIKQNLYNPYQWHIRFFKESTIEETHIFLTPSGTPYGFKKIIPESLKLPCLSQKAARALAEETFEEWGNDLSLFEEIEVSEQTTPYERIDHTFTFKRRDATLGKEGDYRCAITISGNCVTQLKHFVRIPEAFTKRFEELRSNNATLSACMNALFYFLYLFCGALLGTCILYAQRRIFFRPAFWISLILALGLTINHWNLFPILVMNYSTTMPFSTFFSFYIVRSLLIFLQIFALTFLALSAAEGLDRWAFKDHIRYFHVLTTSFFRLHTIRQQTIFSYGLLGIKVGIATGLYYLFLYVFKWWAPAETLADPSSIGSYIPLLNSLFPALQAGIIEEALCRAIPLAGAALLGRYLKKEQLMIGIMLLLQAIIFGGLHVDYPQMPCYFRILEMLPSSCMMGYVYLVFGLYPCIIIHFLYDFIFMSLPLFTTHGSSLCINKLLFFIILCAPLLLVLIYQYFVPTKRPADDDYNNNWNPPLPQKTGKTSSHALAVLRTYAYTPIFKKIILILGIISLIGIPVLWKVTPTCKRTQLTLSEQDARYYAQDYFEKNIPDEIQARSWSILAMPDTLDPLQEQGQRYILQTAGYHQYNRLIGTYIPDVMWHIRYACFEGKPLERAEEYHFWIDNTGKIIRISHTLPESASGETLSKAQARGIALQKIYDLYNLTINDIKEISVVQNVKQNRTDYVFIFCDTTVPLAHPDDQARIMITVSGDEITDYIRYIFAPEQWLRNNILHDSYIRLCSIFVLLLCIALGLLVLSTLFPYFLQNFSLKRFFAWLSIVFIPALIMLYNKLPIPIFAFSTAQSYMQQLCITVSISCAILIIFISILAFFTSSIKKILIERAHSHSLSLQSIPYGIALGLFLSLLIFCITYLAPVYIPFMPSFSILIHSSPLLSAIIQNIPFIICIFTILSMCYLYALTSTSLYRLSIYTVLSFFVITYVLLWTLLSVASLPFLLIGSFISSLLLTIITIGSNTMSAISLISMYNTCYVVFLGYVAWQCPYQNIYLYTTLKIIGIILITTLFIRYIRTKK